MSETKPSGTSWIDTIPATWNIERMKNQFIYSKGLNITKADLVDDGVAVISYGQIHAKNNTGTTLSPELLRYISPENIAITDKSLLHKGDIVFADTSEDYDGLGNAVYMDSDNDTYAGYHTIIARPKNIDYSKYFAYLFKSDAWREQLRVRASGIKVFSVTQRMLNDVTLILPEKNAIRPIISYLDDRCSKIDAIIAEAKASIEEYKELKQAVIYEAVTKGLDKNANLVNCKVNSLNKMPETWRIVPVKYLCSMQAGKNLISEQIADTGIYPVYGGNGLRGYYESYNTEGHRLLIGRQGALCGNIHEVNGKYWCTEHALVTTVKPIVDTHYLYYLFSAMNLNQYASNAAAQPGLAASNILNLRTIIPSLDMQKNISRCLDEKVSQLDSLINEKQALIEDLESYKKSLIYEVVTGKRKVVV